MTRITHRIATGFALGVGIVGLFLGVVDNKDSYLIASGMWFGSALIASQLAVLAERN